jgi:SAM-dependent methyltransferase
VFRLIKKYFMRQVSRLFKEMTRLTSDDGQPNINQIWEKTKDIDILRLNVKNFGYILGRTSQHILNELEISDQPILSGLVSKPTTQKDMESSWFRYWCNELKVVPIYHRKLWEYAFVMQSLFENNMLLPGKVGIGFGCGEEPIASYLASKKIKACVTDLEIEKVTGAGWLESNQHATTLETAFHPNICSRDMFELNVTHDFVDMNHIPSKFEGLFDFCWSICALEHLGSIDLGLKFIENSLNSLKPGGVAIHTTEYNYLSEDTTIDNWSTVLFLRKHFELLSHHINKQGHYFVGPSFDVGNGVLDRFIDIPPYAFGEGWLKKENWSDINQNVHLKLSIDGFACTCFGIIIKKRSE